MYVIVNSALWTIGGFLSIAVIQHIAAIGIIIGLIWALIGNSPTRVIAFPLLYLYFGVPEGEILVPYLRDLTAEVVVNLLRVTGIPVFLEGRYLTIPSGQFHVAKACSGINYLIATLAVGTVFAYTRYFSNWRRAVFILLAIAVPLVANGLRAYGIVMIAHLSNYKYAIGIDHYIYGWVFFGIVIFILFTVGNTFSDKKDAAPERPSIRQPEALNEPVRNPTFLLLILLIIVVAFRGLYSRATDAPTVDDEYAIKASDMWQTEPSEMLELYGSYGGIPTRLKAYFVADHTSDSPVGMEMVLYLNSDDGELENRANMLFDEEKWQRLSGPIIVSTGISEVPTVNEYILRRFGQKHLVWTWYDINQRVLTNRGDVKWSLVKARLRGDYRGGAQTNIVTPIVSDEKEARNVLQTFIQQQNPTMANFRLQSN